MSVYEEWSMACPSCGCDRELKIDAVVKVQLTPDGTTDDPMNGDHTWDNDSPCCCDSCGWAGTVKEATVDSWVLKPAADLAQAALDAFSGEEDSVQEEHEGLITLIQASLDRYSRHEVNQILVLSTGHLDLRCRAWLTEAGNANQAKAYHGHGRGGQISTLGPTMCGWFTVVTNSCAEAPPVLAGIFDYARCLACAYILFDADGPRVETLPWHEEKEEK